MLPATEHSVMCAGEKDNEFETIKRLMNEVYPTGIVSIVSDTWDFWKALRDIYKPLKKIFLLEMVEWLLDLIVETQLRLFTGYDYYTGKKINSSDIERIKAEIYDNTQYNQYDEVVPRDFVCIKTTDNKYFIADDKYPKIVRAIKEISEEEAIGAFKWLWKTFGGTINEKRL